jgi:excisionase family DNA binding protein
VTATVIPFPVRHDPLLNKRMAALELQVSVRTLERMVHDGQVQSIMVRGQRRFRYSDIARLKRKGTA